MQHVELNIKGCVLVLCTKVLIACTSLGGGTDGEVIDPCNEGMTNSVNETSKTAHVESQEHSVVSSDLSESEPDDTEIQSPNVVSRGINPI